MIWYTPIEDLCVGDTVKLTGIKWSVVKFAFPHTNDCPKIGDEVVLNYASRHFATFKTVENTWQVGDDYEVLITKSANLTSSSAFEIIEERSVNEINPRTIEQEREVVVRALQRGLREWPFNKVVKHRVDADRSTIVFYWDTIEPERFF